MAFDINTFKTKVASGVRPNLFRVDFSFPSGVTNNLETITFLCKSAALPSSTMGTIEVPFRGRNLKIPGDRTFDSWTATFINDNNFSTRSTFEQWMNLVNKLDSNVGNLDPSAIFQNIVVTQLGKNGSPSTSASGDTAENLSIVRQYLLYGAWPSSVSQITLGYDQNDQIEEFDVEFQYQYFSIGGGTPAPIS
jgi:T4-like virus tail tube protein gp19